MRKPSGTYDLILYHLYLDANSSHWLISQNTSDIHGDMTVTEGNNPTRPVAEDDFQSRNRGRCDLRIDETNN